MDLTHLPQDKERLMALVNEVINLRVRTNVDNFLTCCGPVSSSTKTLLHGALGL
jgi:hypothetical protein